MICRIRMTSELAKAASWDAANASMRAAGRKAWTGEEVDAANKLFDELWPNCPHGVEPNNCGVCYLTLDERGRRGKV